jgi:hypothetical protein
MTESPYTIEMLNNEIDGIEETPEVEEEDSYLAGTKAIHDSLNAELNQPSEDIDNSNSEDFDFDPGFDDDDLDFIENNTDEFTRDYLLNRRRSTARQEDYDFGSNMSNYDLKPFAKKGARVDNINSNVANLFSFLNSKAGGGLTISSGTDGVHSTPNSTHYYGGGMDVGANSSDKSSYLSMKQLLSDPDTKAIIKQQFDIDEIIDEGDHFHFGSRKKKKMQQGGSSLMNKSSYYPDEMSYNPNTAPPKSFVQNYEDNLKAQPYGQLALEDIDRSQTDKLGWMKGVGNLASKGSNLLNMYDNFQEMTGRTIASGVAGLNASLGARTNNQNMYDEYMKQYGEDQSDYKSLPQGIFQNQRKTYLS